MGSQNGWQEAASHRLRIGIETADPKPPRLGAYRILSPLGGGETGEVYLALDERTDRRVAVKRLRLEEPADALERSRIRREARAVARLDHPAIVQVLDVLEDDEGDSIVMELVEGRDLSEVLAQGEVDVPFALQLAREIAEGLAEAHAKGLVHRDLKPTNVVLTESGRTAPGRTAPGRTAPGRTAPGRTAPGRVRILGFGLPAAPWSEDGVAEGGESGEDSLTEVGECLDTVRTLSPEQMSGHPVDHRTDLFALGALLYEMLTGSPPFRGEGLLETLVRIHSEPPPPISEACPEAPAPVDGLLQRLLAKNPSRRPQSARLVADELELLAALAADPDTSRPEAPAEAATASAAYPWEPESGGSVTRVLVLTELVGAERWARILGQERAAELLARHDREARGLVGRYGGRVVGQPAGFLLLFERSVDAVGFALAYQQALARLSLDEPLHLAARLGVHQGEVHLRPVAPEGQNAGSLEAEGPARLLVERLTAIAHGHQTLLTPAVFDQARGTALAGELAEPQLRWLAHGTYAVAGVDEPMALYEVGVKGLAPFHRPSESLNARRVTVDGGRQTLGWRPAVGQAIPRCPSWELVERLGSEDSGEAWLAAQTSGATRVFRFSFAAAARRSFPFGGSEPQGSFAKTKEQEVRSEAALG